MVPACPRTGPLGVTGNNIGFILFQSRHYDEAIRELRSDLAVHQQDGSIYWFLGFALIADGQADEAIPVLEKAVALSRRSPTVIGVLVRAYAHAGRRAEALRLLDELKRRQRTGYVPSAAFVNAYLGLGDNEQTFAWLERAYKEHSMILQYIKGTRSLIPSAATPVLRTWRAASGLTRLGSHAYRVGGGQAREAVFSSIRSQLLRPTRCDVLCELPGVCQYAQGW